MFPDTAACLTPPVCPAQIASAVSPSAIDPRRPTADQGKAKENEPADGNRQLHRRPTLDSYFRDLDQAQSLVIK